MNTSMEINKMSDYKVFAISLLLFILINYLFQMIKGGLDNRS